MLEIKREVEVKMPEIRVDRDWSADSVRAACVKHGWYTRGNCREYDDMLNVVKVSRPNKEVLFLVAMDIVNHSKVGETISNVMFLLEKEAVTTFYTIFPKEAEYEIDDN